MRRESTRDVDPRPEQLYTRPGEFRILGRGAGRDHWRGYPSSDETLKIQSQICAFQVTRGPFVRPSPALATITLTQQ
jgi:hypothetical protein